MFGLFWNGVAVGAIGMVLPSAVTLAVLFARAPTREEDASTLQHELLPLSMESLTSGL